jgi:hypothetical protein
MIGVLPKSITQRTKGHAQICVSKWELIVVVSFMTLPLLVSADR